MKSINIFKGTNTLDLYIKRRDYKFTQNKAITECLLIGGKKINLSEYPNLKGIFKTGVGTDNLPFKEAKERNIKICLPSSKTCDFIYEETASFTCHLIFKALYKSVGNWDKWYKKPRNAISKQNILILGKGKIGTKVFQKLKLFMNVDSFDILTDRPEALKSKINNADIVSIHVPLNKDTEGMIDKEKLSWMKDGALLVNTARAQIINEEDLYNELKSERIKSALDVFWQEPYDGIMLSVNKNNLITTPHLASTCKEFLINAEEDFFNFLNDLNHAL